jgi:branched-chain amino acid transport system substrate-binding protein
VPRLVLAALVALALAGCGATGSTRISSDSLTIYTSLPLHGERVEEARAVLRGEKLALEEAGGSVGQLKVGLVALDDADQHDRWAPGLAAANARAAAKNPSTIAYVGDLDSGATAVSLPITNEIGVLHVSPLSGYTGLTAPGDKGEPDKYYPSARPSFARLVPNGAVEARALARWMAQRGVRRVTIATDGSQEGLGLVRDLERAMRGRSQEEVDLVRVDADARDVRTAARDLVRAPADALVWTGPSTLAALGVLRAVHDLRPGLELYATSGVAGTGLAAGLGPAAPSVRVTSPLILARRRGARALDVAGRYDRTFGSAAPPAALYGYEAVRGILAAIRAAGDDGNDRAAVIRAYLAARTPTSVLGAYGFDRRGDVTSTVYGGYRVARGRLVFDRTLDGSAG